MLQKGMTLIECLVVISIIGLMAGMAAPSFNNLREQSSLRGAALRLYSDLNEARVKTIKSGIKHELRFTGSKDYVLKKNGNTLEKLSFSNNYKNISFDNSTSSSYYIAFNNKGFPLGSFTKNLYLKHSKGKTLKIIVEPLGEIRIEHP